MDVPFAAWMEEIPRSATSDEVSKPKPNMTPRGYIFHGLEVMSAPYNNQRKVATYVSIIRNIFFMIPNKQPAPLSSKPSAVSGRGLLFLRNMFSCFTNLNRMKTFMMPRTMRNPAETEDPIIPPIWLYLSNLSRTVAAVAATTVEVIMTILCEDQQMFCFSLYEMTNVE